MRGFLLQTVFSLVLLSFHRHGNATRYLPSIVWDHYNPMLACKCNWFNFARFEIYDRFDFVCPTLQLSVGLLDSQSRPKAHMNYHILMRKWKGGTDYEGLNELKRNMTSGEFCNPSHKETQKLYTCKNGDDNQGYTVRFARDNDFYKGDLVVFFNNEADGLVSDLTSNDKRCAMAFVVNVTWGAPVNYDFSYGKNLDGKRKGCNHINMTCSSCDSTPEWSFSTSSTPSTQAGSTTANSSAKPTGNITTATTTTKTTTTKATTSTTKPTVGCNNSLGCKSTTADGQINNASSSGRHDPDNCKKWDHFIYGCLGGFAAATFLNILAAIIYCRCHGRLKIKQKTKTHSACEYKNSNGNVPSVILNNNLGEDKEAKPLPEKTSFSGTISDQLGINNIGFHGTMKRDSTTSPA